MAADVKFQVDAETAKAINGYLRLVEAQKKSTRESQKSTRETKKHEKAIFGVLNAAKGMAGALGIGLGVAGFLSLVKRELDAIRQQQSRAAQTATSVSEARTAALVNRPSDFPIKEVERIVREASAQSGLTQQRLFVAMATALSAKGALSADAFESQFKLAARVAGRSPEQFDIDQLVGGFLDISKATGLKDANSVFGFLRQIGAEARVTSLKGQAETIPRALGVAEILGTTLEEAGEFYAAFTQLSVDPEGSATVTGFVNFAASLKEILEERFPEAMELKSLSERLAFIQQRFPTLPVGEQRAIMSAVKGKGAIKAIGQGFIAGSPLAMGALQRARENITAPGTQAQVDLSTGLFADVDASGISAVQQLRMLGETLPEQLRLDNTGGAIRGELRSFVDKVLQETPGVSDLHRRSIMAAFELQGGLGGGDPSTIISNVQNRLRATGLELQTDIPASPGFIRGDMEFGRTAGRERSAQERSAGEALERAAAKLDQIAEVLLGEPKQTFTPGGGRFGGRGAGGSWGGGTTINYGVQLDQSRQTPTGRAGL